MERKSTGGLPGALAAAVFLASTCLLAQTPSPTSDPIADIRTGPAYGPSGPLDRPLSGPGEREWPVMLGKNSPPPLSQDTTFTSPSQSDETTLTNTAGPVVVSVGQLQHPLTYKGLRLLRRIQSYLRQGDRAKAQQEFRQALKEQSAAPYARALIGTDYLRNGESAAAVAELEKAAQVLPLASVHSNLGYALSLTGDTPRGQKELEEALRLDATSRQAQFVLGVLLLDHRSRDHEALENLRGAQQQVPEAHMALAVFYVRDRNYDAAEQEIRGFLGPDRSAEFTDAWNWACLVAAGPKPATAFGLDRQ